ncbi:MAG: bifunctional nicotinamide mononucleotide [Caudoviricetes sp.]|nr:MAG: bifunctional nicotinamide mononucleotide [Caudoviricetes sp.]
MKKKYDIVVYIGRFQPFTKNGHDRVVKAALTYGNKLVMGIGSSNKERSEKNPFSYYERCNIIKKVTNNDNILFRPLDDYESDDEWIENVKFQIEQACVTIGIDSNVAKIALIGMDKDESSYYLKYFSFWDYICFEKPTDEIVSATDVRKILFCEKTHINETLKYVHQSTLDFLTEFKNTKTFKMIKETIK